jgi:polysaccharide biosynthesis/export protein
MTIAGLVLIAALSGLAQPAAAQTAAQPAAAPGKYLIGPQDQLKISVYDADELTGTYRVDADGFITFPLLNRIAVAGLTLAEFQDRLKAMLASGYIRNPQVRVDIEEYKSQSLYVSGEVRSPGEIRMTGTMTLMKALAQAGSPLSSASSELTIARQKKPSGGAPLGATPAPDSDVIRVNWRDLETGKGVDIPLQDGDVIHVGKAQTFYITGYVRTAGSYVLEPGMTVEQAIALAGGLTEKGTTRGIRATRLIKGKSTEVQLNLDDRVQPNDVITIKQRWF